MMICKVRVGSLSPDMGLWPRVMQSRLLSVLRPLPTFPALLQPRLLQRSLPLESCFARRLGLAARVERATAIGATPDAALRKYKPKTDSLRHRVTIDKRGLWPGRPVKSLITRVNIKAGRGSTGAITVRGRCAPKHRRMYRLIDFHRRREDPAIVQRFEYDPNRSSFIALVKYRCSASLHTLADTASGV